MANFNSEREGGLFATFSVSKHKAEWLSELTGTFLLVLIGPSSVVITHLVALPSTEALAIVAFVFGATVATVILLLGRISGAHINPAITTASTFAGRLRLESFLPYIMFQALGCLLAGMCLRAIFSPFGSPAHLGSTLLAASVTPIEGVAIELVGTFVLALSALTASACIKTPVGQAALIGSTLFLLVILIGPLTGASFNPARSLGPSVFSGYFENQGVYWVGPLVGGACAGLIFRLWKPISP